jgi:hypothetical protein
VSTPLENLARIGKLKAETRNHAEIKRLLQSAQTHLSDAQAQTHRSAQGRFLSAYAAGHAAALAALRWHGYRSENRYLVFQALTHTIGWEPSQWRALDAAHTKRNLAEYEGFIEIEETQIATLVETAQALIHAVTAQTS